ncbi:MAG: tRNA 2-thiouridine(34) synthase MnmA [Bacilli bacterium]
MKVMLGLSGGVDSAVAAYLLKKDGYEVIGCFMRNWDALANNDYLGNPTINDSQCPQEADYEDAKAVAEKLGIQFLRIDFVKEYWDNVFSYFLEEYKLGRTPNPDVFCNKYIKFDAFLSFALKSGCDMIAMGHYAKRIDKNGMAYLGKAHDLNKDQSYFLCQISEEQLSHSLFPLGEIDKPEVRRIAQELDLKVATKKDSTGICFIGERNFRKFLQNYIPAKRGEIRNIDTNEVIGKHEGVLYYTIGQRKGLGIGGIKGIENTRWFVTSKDVKKNILYVSSGDENDHLFSDSSIINKCNFIGYTPVDGEEINVKFRYRQTDLPCKVQFINSTTLKLIHLQKYKAVTPGQIAAFYKGDLCIGGGIIDKVMLDSKELVYFK